MKKVCTLRTQDGRAVQVIIEGLAEWDRARELEAARQSGQAAGIVGEVEVPGGALEAQALQWLIKETRRTGEHEAEIGAMSRFLSLLLHDTDRGGILVDIGITFEKMRRYDHAVEAYSLATGCATGISLYWAHNNLGYSLNQTRAFAEAEAHCRKAIAIMPALYNAHKNLGVALQGLGDYAGAAASLLKAIEFGSTNGRAALHLQDLLAAHPEVASVLPQPKDIPGMASPEQPLPEAPKQNH